MDGFDHALQNGLRRSQGDLTLYSRDGLITEQEYQKILKTFETQNITEHSPYLQTEGFLSVGGSSRGVILKGVDPIKHSKIIGKDLKLNIDEGLVIGSELATQLSLKVGDEVALALSRGNERVASLPKLSLYKVSQIISHGIYEKDLRFAYIDLKTLRGVFDNKDVYNLIALNIPEGKAQTQEDIEFFAYDLETELGYPFVTRTFWSEFSGLIEAVEIEKISLSIILQLVVFISIFNIIAFILYINEKKAPDFFLFCALGTTKKQLVYFWSQLISLIWVLSCVVSILMLVFFNYGLQNFPIFKIPGEIYVLQSLKLVLDLGDYGLVFFFAFLWLMLVTVLGPIRWIRRRPILEGLRKEFG